MKHGKVVASTVGYMSEEELKSFVASAKGEVKTVYHNITKRMGDL